MLGSFTVGGSGLRRGGLAAPAASRRRFLQEKGNVLLKVSPLEVSDGFL